MTEIPTVLSAAHKKVIKQLENWGIQLMEEVDFPPYRADCYLPDIHVVIEVDGPHHSKKADEKRDAEFLKCFFLPTFRIKTKDATHSERWKSELFAFLNKHAWTATERWEKCSPRTPWL